MDRNDYKYIWNSLKTKKKFPTKTTNGGTNGGVPGPVGRDGTSFRISEVQLDPAVTEGTILNEQLIPSTNISVGDIFLTQRNIKGETENTLTFDLWKITEVSGIYSSYSFIKSEELTSIQGPQGEQGNPGDEGPVGPTGPNGTPIELSNDFVIDDQGKLAINVDLTGPTGPQGPMGPSGLNGADGKDALIGTITAVTGTNLPGESASVTATYSPSTASNTKDITFTFNNIKGQTGSVGPTGPNGTPIELSDDFVIDAEGKLALNVDLVGPTGPQGNRGPTGNDGADGVDGKDGKDALIGTITAVTGTNDPSKAATVTASYSPTGASNAKDITFTFNNIKGQTGNVGPTGPNGTPIELSNDFIINSEGKLAVNVDLVGPTGPTGKTGEKGIDGSDGKDGADGKDAKIGSITASINTDGSYPGPHVEVGYTPTGESNTKDISFTFSNLKGDAGNIGPTGPNGTPIELSNDFVIDTSGKLALNVDLVGPTGPTGLQGPQGIAGVTSVIASIGDKINDPTVDASLNGQQLVLNFNGLVGPTGNIGPEGPSGDRGPQGPSGNKGDKGDVGPTGPNGTPIELSDDFVIDSAGKLALNVDLVGPQGPQGEPGTPGTPGTPGAPGNNAYITGVTASIGTGTGTPSVSVTNIGTTSNANFKFAFDNLKAPTPVIKAATNGNTNKYGTANVLASTSGNTTTFTFEYIKGPTGPKGDSIKGDTGPTGNPGPQGKVGPTGPNGTPIELSDDFVIDSNGRLALNVDLVGPTGPKGKDGINGTNGTDGKDGTDGSPGRDGTDGTNAYITGIHATIGNNRGGMPTVTGYNTGNSQNAYFEFGFDHIIPSITAKTASDVNTPGTPYVSASTSSDNITTFTFGQLKGLKGDPGKDGRDGVDGSDGRDGAPGAPGPTGPNGTPIELSDDFVIDSSGRLALNVDLVGPKGDKGDRGNDGTDGRNGTDGTPAYISSVTASLTENGGSPSASLVNTGTTQNANLNLTLYNLKGDKGDPGTNAQIVNAEAILIKNNPAEWPTVSVTMGGTSLERTFTFLFENIKGAPGLQGPEGPQGPQGPQGPTGDKGDRGDNKFSMSLSGTTLVITQNW